MEVQVFLQDYRDAQSSKGLEKNATTSQELFALEAFMQMTAGNWQK